MPSSPIPRNPYEQRIVDFYAAFAARDAVKMAEQYHRDIAFTDPAFPMLRGDEATAMWAMLVSRAKDDFSVALISVEANAEGGHATWEAHYTFSQTGRKVHNIISASFAFREGRIVRHVDQFPFWRWSRQAFGATGVLIGWSLPFKALVRRRVKDALVGFMERGTHPRPA
jgi:ketosteroid isomerase-like protein